MEIRTEKIKYTNFEDEESVFILIGLETYNQKDNNYDRTFIGFEEEDVKDLDKLVSIIKKNEKEIHLAIGNLDKIEKIIDQEYIKITAYTTMYWSDVRLFTHISKFAYADDVFNTSAIEHEVHKFIRDKYYNKERLVESCNNENIPEVIKILHQSKFKEEDIKDILAKNSNIRKIFDSNSLYELLSETFDSNGKSKTSIKNKKI